MLQNFLSFNPPNTMKQNIHLFPSFHTKGKMFDLGIWNFTWEAGNSSYYNSILKVAKISLRFFSINYGIIQVKKCNLFYTF